MGNARSAFDAAVTAHLDAAALLRGAQADAREDNAQVRQLHERLTSQAARLGAAAGQLGLPEPRLSVESAPATPDLNAALNRAEGAIQHADSQLGRALRAGALPVLLPNVSPALRATLVFGGFCVLAWIVQFVALVATDYSVPTAVGSLCALPLLAFGAGAAALHTLGQPPTGDRIAYSLKLGAVICFAGLPLLWLALLVAIAIVRG